MGKFNGCSHAIVPFRLVLSPFTSAHQTHHQVLLKGYSIFHFDSARALLANLGVGR